MASPIKLSDELLCVIGRIVVYHAEIEHWLDAMVNALHRYHPATHQFSKQYPLTFADETEFLRKCLTGLPELEQYRAEGIEILNILREISEDRAHIIHGFVQRWDQERKHLEFLRIRKMEGIPAAVIVSISEEQLIRDSERIDAFRDPVEKFGLRIMEEFMSEERFQEATRGMS